MKLRTHKRRAAAGMTRRLVEAIRLGLRYGPACHPFVARCQWSFNHTTPWNPFPPRLFQNDRTTVDYTRSGVRGHEYTLNIRGAATAARRRGDRLLRQWAADHG